MIIASGVIFVAWHLANEMGESRVEKISIPPTDVRASERSAREITPDQWDGLVQVWHSIRERFDRDPNAAIVYADLVISDLMLDIDGPRPQDGNELCNFGSPRVKSSYEAAHEITATRQLRPLSPAEMQRAMALYIAVFNEIFGSMEHAPHTR